MYTFVLLNVVTQYSVVSSHSTTVTLHLSYHMDLILALNTENS